MLARLFSVCLSLIFIAASVGVHAEVSVRTDRQGNYLSVQVTTSGPLGAEEKVWSPRGSGVRRPVVLNPFGDANGDLWPSIAEANESSREPWVVWSRFNGVEYNVAWARWSKHGWTSINWIDAKSGLGDDLDPDIAFDGSGRAYCVWWRDSAGGGRVYASVYEGQTWSGAFLLSDPAEDSRYPTLSSGPGGVVSVRYETPQGIANEVLTHRDPDTITDDIDPQLSINGSLIKLGNLPHEFGGRR